jgi:hypothetical protein
VPPLLLFLLVVLPFCQPREDALDTEDRRDSIAEDALDMNRSDRLDEDAAKAGFSLEEFKDLRFAQALERERRSGRQGETLLANEPA